MIKYNTIIIGAGASGILAAITLNDKNSILLEKNDIIGKKLLITGGTRCNLTNNSSFDQYMKSYYNSGKYYREAFMSFFNKDIINLLEKNGCKTKIEEDGRIFPVSDDAKTVQQTLKKILDNSNTQYKLNSNVENVEKKEDYYTVTYNGTKIHAENIILATGSNTYPKTGSTGDGYEFAKNLGHTLSKDMAGLCPIKIKETWINKLQAITFKAVVEIKSDKKRVSYEEGQILITHYGFSGFVILNNSMLIERELRKNRGVTINFDLMKDYNYEQLDIKMQEDFSKRSRQSIKRYLQNVIPKNMAIELLKHLNINENTKLNQITKKERIIIRDNLKRLSFKVDKIMTRERIVTNSGIKQKEINPTTFESKINENLYITGELIEGCGICGGYNLQKAFSTGVLAAKSIKMRNK